jgi:hypothetical protein
MPEDFRRYFTATGHYFSHETLNFLNHPYPDLSALLSDNARYIFEFNFFSLLSFLKEWK